MMQTWGLSTSTLFSAGLLCLIFITFLAGLVKVWFNKRDLKKKIKLANLEAANERTDKEKLVGERELDEGDLFGVRAIQAGFFGGVTQSCPNSPAVSRSSSLHSLGKKHREELRPKSPLSPSHPIIPRKDLSPTESSSCKTIPPPPQQNRNLCPSDKIALETRASNHEPDLNKTDTPPPADLAIPSILRIRNRIENKNAVPKLPKPVLQTVVTSNACIEDPSSPVSTPSLRENFPIRNASIPSNIQASSTRSKPSHTLPPKGYSRPPEENHQRDFPLVSISLSSLANLPRTISPNAVIRDSVVSKQKVSIYQPPAESSVETAHQSTIETRLSRIATPSPQPEEIISAPLSNENEDSSSNSIRTHNDDSQGLPTSDSARASSSLSQDIDSNDSRYSPYSISHTTAHSSNSSLSSISNIDRYSALADAKVPAASSFGFQPLEESQPSSNHTSKSSQGSIGDFYDTYFRRSILRQSVLEQAREIEIDWREKSGNTTFGCLPASHDHDSKSSPVPKVPTKNLVLEF